MWATYVVRSMNRKADHLQVERGAVRSSAASDMDGPLIVTLGGVTALRDIDLKSRNSPLSLGIEHLIFDAVEITFAAEKAFSSLQRAILLHSHCG